MIIHLDEFTGEFPRLEPYKLPQNAASRAVNCDFSNNALAPLANGSVVSNGTLLGVTRAMWYHEGYPYAVYQWPAPVTVARGAVPEDQWVRFYWSWDGYKGKDPVTGVNVDLPAGMYVSSVYTEVNSQGVRYVPYEGNNFHIPPTDLIGVPKPVAPLYFGSMDARVGYKEDGSRTWDNRGTNDILFGRHNGFTILDVDNIDYWFAAEHADGTFSHESPVVRANTLDWMTWKNAGLSTIVNDMPTVGDQSTSSSVITNGTGSSTIVGYYMYDPSGAGLLVPAYVYNGVTYIDVSGLPTTVTRAAGGTIQLTQTDQYSQPFGMAWTFYYCADPNWVSINSSDPGPNLSADGGGGAGGSVTTDPKTVVGVVAKVRLNLGNGKSVVATVREGGQTTDWPIELPGYTASLARNGTLFNITFGHSKWEARAYVYTFVNTFGEEGPPSDPVIIDCIPGKFYWFNFGFNGPVGVVGFRNIQKIRLYRTATGSAGSQYLFVREYSRAAGDDSQFDPANLNPGEWYSRSVWSAGDWYAPSQEILAYDDVKSENLGLDTLLTAEYDPPSSWLRGLCMMANGVLAAFKDNEVHFSEPYLGYAWKKSNIKTFPTAVRGIIPMEGGLLVTTATHPYVISGVDPANMSSSRLTAIQAGISNKSMCDLGKTIAYASTDGIVLVRGTEASLDTSFQFYTRKDWYTTYCSGTDNKGKRPIDYMNFAAHDGGLLIWFDPESQGLTPLYFRFDEERLSLTEITDFHPRFVYVDPISDALLYARSDIDMTSLYKFRGDATRMTATWASKEFALPKPTSFGVVQINAIGAGSSYPVACTVQGWDENGDEHTYTGYVYPTGAPALRFFRLPSGYLLVRVKLTLRISAPASMALVPIGGTGQPMLFEINLASTISELQNV